MHRSVEKRLYLAKCKRDAGRHSGKAVHHSEHTLARIAAQECCKPQPNASERLWSGRSVRRDISSNARPFHRRFFLPDFKTCLAFLVKLQAVTSIFGIALGAGNNMEARGIAGQKPLFGESHQCLFRRTIDAIRIRKRL